MADRTCSIDGCEKTVKARSWCENHYMLWRRHGDPTVVAHDHDPDISARFARRAVRAENGCLEWTGTRRRDGYGTLKWKGNTLLAYRVAYELAHGPIPDGLCVCHRCDNPPCVDVDHLFLGSRSENAADMQRKGRRASVLTATDVRSIRAEVASGRSTQRDQARLYGVSPVTIHDVVHRVNWRHIE